MVVGWERGGGGGRLSPCFLEFGAALGWGLEGWSPTPVLGQVELGLRLGLGWDSEQGPAGGEATVMSFKSCIAAG